MNKEASKERFFIETWEGNETDNVIRNNLEAKHIPITEARLFFKNREPFMAYEIPPSFINSLAGMKTKETLYYRVYKMDAVGTVQRWRLMERGIRKKAKNTRDWRKIHRGMPPKHP